MAFEHSSIRTEAVREMFVGFYNRGFHKVLSQCLFWSKEPKKEFVPSYPAFQVTVFILIIAPKKIKSENGLSFGTKKEFMNKNGSRIGAVLPKRTNLESWNGCGWFSMGSDTCQN